METSTNKFEIIHETINKSTNRLSITMLCDIAGVSRSGYYNWVKTEGKRLAREEQDRKDFEIILKAYTHRGYDKGAQGIYMRLIHMEPPVVMNVKKIRRLMKKYGLICGIRKANPYRRMAKAIKTNHVAADLVQRKFESYGPRAVLLTDITYIPFKGKFCYLSTILDAFTKQILSYVLSESLEVDSNIRYRLRMCIWKHWKTAKNRARNLMKLDVPRWAAFKIAYCGDRYARLAYNGWVQKAISNKRLADFGLISMRDYHAERRVTC